jgi:hypothetical protein
LGIFVVDTIGRMPSDCNLLSLDTSLAIPTLVLRFEVSERCRRTPVRPIPTGQIGQMLLHFGLRSWLCGSTKEPSDFVVNHWKLRGLGVAYHQSPFMTWLPRRPDSTLVLRLNQETVHDSVLLFLPPCGPHLTPLSTGSLEPSLLVCSTPGGLTGIDLSLLFFTCTSTNQVAACTCNTRPRVSPYNIFNHLSHQEATIHRSSNHTSSHKLFYLFGGAAEALWL